LNGLFVFYLSLGKLILPTPVSRLAERAILDYPKEEAAAMLFDVGIIDRVSS
jgi:hypothetical protein